MRDDFDQFGMHDCQRCKQQFPEFMFHLAAGYCDDCYDIIQDEMEETTYDGGKGKMVQIVFDEAPAHSFGFADKVKQLLNQLNHIL